MNPFLTFRSIIPLFHSNFESIRNLKIGLPSPYHWHLLGDAFRWKWYFLRPYSLKNNEFSNYITFAWCYLTIDLSRSLESANLEIKILYGKSIKLKINQKDFHFHVLWNFLHLSFPPFKLKLILKVKRFNCKWRRPVKFSGDYDKFYRRVLNHWIR